MEFRVLGPIEVHEGGRPVRLGAPKQRAVLAALLLRRNRVVTREALVDAVWGEEPPDAAVQSLQVYVHGLRRALGADRIETRGTGYLLRVEPDELDLERFERLLERARRSLASGDAAAAGDEVRGALALWAGPPLADLASEAVVAAHAGPVDDLRLEALELHGDVELALGRHAALLPELETRVAEHPFRERLREQLALALYRSGRQTEALEALRAARKTFDEELGLDPGPGLRELERAILRHDASLAAPEAAAPPELRLPVPPTTLVGRRLELAAIASLFDEGARLVTLTGPGGTGKTRLALAAAEEIGGNLSDGAVFVDLSAVADPELLGPSIAAAVGVKEGDERLADALGEHLRPRSVLLLLDNLEQLLPGTPFVSELLARAPRLRVLATSRSPLRLSAEYVYDVPPFELPAADASFEQLAANDAVRLFAQRARAADAGFQLTDGNASSVAAICRRLDGLPLAIELAAARTRLLPPEALAQQLGAALDLLTEGPRDVAPRQQTLRATLDWSYRALPAANRRLLAGLAVFAGGCALAAVETVCGGGASLDALAVLADVSLLRRITPPDAEPRFAMLETIREYARELLAASGEESVYRRRHCEHFVVLAEEWYAELNRGTGGEAAFERLERDHENVREALAWAAASGEAELEGRLAIAMSRFWNVRGHLSEGRRVFEHVLPAARESDERLYAQALVHAAVFPYRQGDIEVARRWWEESLELFRQHGDVEGITRANAELGAVAVAEGDLERSRALYEEAARGFAELGQPVRVGIATANLSAIAAMQGDLPSAARYGLEAAELQEEIGDTDSLAVTLQNVSRVLTELGEADRGRELLGRSLRLARSLSYKEVVAHCIEGAAEVAASEGDERLALRLLAASEAAFGRLGVPLLGDEAESAEALTRQLTESLGSQALDEARAAAQTEPEEQAVDEALNLLERPRGRRPRHENADLGQT